jgi:pimeloyl-ACP methyl ester carboxylesterase
LMDRLATGNTQDNDAVLARLGELFGRTDAFDPEDSPPENILTPIEAYQAVWREGAAWRREGKLLDLVSAIRCPVVAIHGDYDPHPADGVRIPLESRLPDFRLVLLSHCGHAPWRERQAKADFYQLLRLEIGGAGG